MHYLRDSLHGDVGLYPLEYALLEAVEVQRLNRLRPLHFVPFVFPGATHSQFSHALGAVATVQRIIKESNLLMSIRERRIVRLAALLHDCSHMAHENVLRPALAQSRRVRVVPRKRAVEGLFDGTTRGWWMKYHAPAMAAVGKPKFVCELLKGDVARDVHAVLTGEGGHLSELLVGMSKEREHITAEQLDFIRRDSKELGLAAASYDDSIFSGFEIAKDDSGRRHIEIRDNPIVLSAVEDVIYARWHLSRHAYLHHAVVAAGTMLFAAVETTLNSADSECLHVLDDEELLRYVVERRAPFTDQRELHDGLASVENDASTGPQLAARLIHRRLFKRAYVAPSTARALADRKLTPREGNPERKEFIRAARAAGGCEILIGEPIFAHTPLDYSNVGVGKKTLRTALQDAGLDRNIGMYGERYKHLDVYYIFASTSEIPTRKLVRIEAEKVFGASDFYLLRTDTTEELRFEDTWEEIFAFVETIRRDAPGTLPILRLIVEEGAVLQEEIIARLAIAKATASAHLARILEIHDAHHLQVLSWTEEATGAKGRKRKRWSIQRQTHRDLLRETLGFA